MNRLLSNSYGVDILLLLSVVGTAYYASFSKHEETIGSSILKGTGAATLSAIAIHATGPYKWHQYGLGANLELMAS